MIDSLAFILFKVVWQDLIEDAVYDSTRQNWQALQVIIDAVRNNKQVSQDLAVALEKCFYSSDKKIADKCREELIKNSAYTQYRGAKIYKPAENDIAIRKLENKIKLSDKYLKDFDKKIFAKKSFINLSDLEELVKQLSQSGYENSVRVKEDAKKHLLEVAEKDCDVNVYKTAIRDKENGLRKLIFKGFLQSIEHHDDLNRMFNAKTYLMLNQIREIVL